MKENLIHEILGILEGHTDNPSKTPIVNFTENFIELDNDFHKELKDWAIMRLSMVSSDLDTLNPFERFAFSVLLNTF